MCATTFFLAEYSSPCKLTLYLDQYHLILRKVTNRQGWLIKLTQWAVHNVQFRSARTLHYVIRHAFVIRHPERYILTYYF